MRRGSGERWGEKEWWKEFFDQNVMFKSTENYVLWKLCSPSKISSPFLTKQIRSQRNRETHILRPSFYYHIHNSTCFDYSVMNPYNLYSPIMTRLCVPAPNDIARCLHPCDPTFKGLYFSNHPGLHFLRTNTYHVYSWKKILNIYNKTVQTI